MLSLSSKAEIISKLKQQMLSLDYEERSRFSSGLDSIIPNGFCRGTIVEYLGDYGNGATKLALLAAQQACRNGGRLVIIERGERFYVPAAVKLGVNLQTIFIQTDTLQEQFWAMNQCLSCSGIGAVLSWAHRIEPKIYRSLQLAAEKGSTFGLFVRPTTMRGEPSWAEMQLLVEPLTTANTKRRLRIEVIRNRGGMIGASVGVEIDDDTCQLRTTNIMPLAT